MRLWEVGVFRWPRIPGGPQEIVRLVAPGGAAGFSVGSSLGRFCVQVFASLPYGWSVVWIFAF